MNSQLPQELFDTILENLNVDIDQWTLRCCSLACSSLLHSSRRQIFRRIVLIPPSRYGISRSKPKSYCQRFYNLLINHPHIATFIQELKLYEGQVCKDQAWLGSDPSLPLVLGMLKDLKRIEFRRLEWSRLPLVVRQSIQDVLGLPSLRFVHMERSSFANMNDFSSLLSHAEGLTGLSLDEIYTNYRHWKPVSPELSNQEKDTKEQGVHSRRRRHLRDLRLSVNEYSIFVNWLLGPQSLLDVSHIRTLHIMHCHPSEVHIIQVLLHAIGSSLNYFKFEAPDNYWTGFDDEPLADFNVERNPNIKSLHITDIQMLSPSSGNHKDTEELRWLKHFLSDVGESCRLEEIKLEVDISNHAEDRIMDWSPWEDVDRILVGMNFKSLRKVDIDLRDTYGTGNYPESCENVARRFPLLRADGVSVDVE